MALQGEKAPYWPGEVPLALIPEQSTAKSPQMYPKRSLMLVGARLGLAAQPRLGRTQLQRPSLGVGGRLVAASQTPAVGEGQGGAELEGV